MFIINFVCVDFFLLIIGMLFIFVLFIKYEWVFGDIWCKVNGMVNFLFCIVLILILVVVLVDWYCVIFYFFKYVIWIMSKVVVGMIVYIWFYVLFMVCFFFISWF